MDRITDIIEKFKDLGTLGGSDVIWLLMKIKDLETQLTKTSKYEQVLREIADMSTLKNDLVDAQYVALIALQDENI